jgi:WD40 repeat protein
MDDLQISPDSKHILVRKSGRVVILDAFDGTRKHDLGQGNVSVACFSPCGHFVYAGSTNGHIFVWRTQNGEEMTRHIGQCIIPPQLCNLNCQSGRN